MEIINDIQKDILKIREDFLKNNDLKKVKKIVKNLKIKKFPVVDNLSDKQLAMIMESINTFEIVVNLLKKYKLHNLDFDIKEVEETLFKIMEGEEIEIEEDKLAVWEIMFRLQGLPFTVIWKILKDNIDLSKYDDNYCPICGGEFEYAYIDEDGKKFLVCALCRFPWRYSRIKCPFCENEDQNNFSYFQFEDEYDFVRIYNCDNCGESHKVLLIDKIKNYPSVEIAHIETIPLELAIEDEYDDEEDN